MLTFAILGGIMLNIGAFLTFRGKIYEAVSVYLVADLCWIAMAWERNDFTGMVFIAVGILFGFLAFMKMQRGSMEKSLTKEKRNEEKNV